MSFITKKVGKFQFIEEGSGHPIVLLHGLMGGLGNFDKQIHHFIGEGYKVFAPKLPIFSLPVIRTNVSSIAKYVLKFLETVVGEPSTLLGNSLGGHIGLVLSHDHPSWVHSLALTGSSGLYEKSFGDTFPKRGSYEYVKQKAEEVFYDPKMATKEIVDEVYDTVNNRKKAIKTLYIARSAMKHNMRKELDNIKQPVCLIWGKQDTVTPPDVAVEFDKYLLNSTLHWLDKCGHAPMMEHPEKFNELFCAWLAKVTS